jgi:RNA polymerase sigma-70 factor (ECF subfamily)
MEKDLTDEQLVKRYLKGHTEAFDILTQRHLTGLYSFLFKYMKTAADSEDVAQQAFLKAWKNLKRFNPRYSFKTWLYTIAKRTALDSLKKKGFVPEAALPEAAEGTGRGIMENIADNKPLLPETLESLERVEALNWAILQLPEKHRHVLSLYYQEDLNFREIAEKLKSSINTVKTRHRRGVLQLKKIFLDK